MNRRAFLKSATAACASLVLARVVWAESVVKALNPHLMPTKAPAMKPKPLRADDNPTPKVTLTPAQWQVRLSPAAYAVLREHDTEPARTSVLDKEYGTGTYHCAGCGLSVFSSAHKFDSGTGWPSFYQPINPAQVGTTRDWKLLYPRTEVHCVRCEGHLGHVFSDGPKPTGLRYCMNGVALTFQPV
ncbi:MAG: peptide-methionine (R)-S-oxide reductase MsrB [Alphaproteobacteria bacterium]